MAVVVMVVVTMMVPVLVGGAAFRHMRALRHPVILEHARLARWRRAAG